LLYVQARALKGNLSAALLAFDAAQESVNAKDAEIARLKARETEILGELSQVFSSRQSSIQSTN
jgi:hypothetical protein